MLATSSDFNPATSRRTFRIIASDYVVAAIFIPVVERLAQEAPSVRLELAAPFENGSAEIAEGKADILITPDFYLRDEHPVALLFKDRTASIGRALRSIGWTAERRSIPSGSA